MNKLEQYISDRKSQFEEEPAKGHFERMQQKINRKSDRIIALRRSVSIAAFVALLFSIGIIWQNIKSRDEKTTACENAVDMKSCYLNKMNVVAARIEALTEKLDSWDRQQVMTDVQNIIDEAGSNFENEIPKELPTKETKLILSNYYRHNLESLEMVAKKVSSI